MSWDVLLINVPPEIISVEDLPSDFSSVLGEQDAIQAKLKAILPDIDLSDPTWGMLVTNYFCIEFNIGDKNPIVTIMLHVRGGDSSIDTIRRICEATGWRAYDNSTGEFINFKDNPAQGLREWRAYKERVVTPLTKKEI